MFTRLSLVTALALAGLAVSSGASASSPTALTGNIKCTAVTGDLHFNNPLRAEASSPVGSAMWAKLSFGGCNRPEVTSGSFKVSNPTTISNGCSALSPPAPLSGQIWWAPKNLSTIPVFDDDSVRTLVAGPRTTTFSYKDGKVELQPARVVTMTLTTSQTLAQLDGQCRSKMGLSKIPIVSGTFTVAGF